MCRLSDATNYDLNSYNPGQRETIKTQINTISTGKDVIRVEYYLT